MACIHFFVRAIRFIKRSPIRRYSFFLSGAVLHVFHAKCASDITMPIVSTPDMMRNDKMMIKEDGAKDVEEAVAWPPGVLCMV